MAGEHPADLRNMQPADDEGMGPESLNGRDIKRGGRSGSAHAGWLFRPFR
jgi:hypothetical protein